MSALGKRDLGALAAIFGAYGILWLLGITCPIKFLTGLSCPGCGMTRAWIALLGGDLAAAFFYHPLFWTAPPAALVFLLRDRLSAKWVQRGGAALCVIFCAVYLARLCTGAAPQVVAWTPANGLIWRLWSWALNGFV